ncbi:MAG: hypothetical protein MI919_15195, partial [Holophagales bacterium]|nr:hypothetical protein [Holophagales bacterium]
MKTFESTPRRSPFSRIPGAAPLPILWALLLSLLLASPLWAQLARVSVTVTDEAGEALQGVSIRGVQEETGVDV